MHRWNVVAGVVSGRDVALGGGGGADAGGGGDVGQVPGADTAVFTKEARDGKSSIANIAAGGLRLYASDGARCVSNVISSSAKSPYDSLRIPYVEFKAAWRSWFSQQSGGSAFVPNQSRVSSL